MYTRDISSYLKFDLCVLQCAARVCCSVLQCTVHRVRSGVTIMCCTVLQSVLQCVVVHGASRALRLDKCVLQCVAVCCSVLQCTVHRIRSGTTNECRSVLQNVLRALQCMVHRVSSGMTIMCRTVLQDVLQCVAMHGASRTFGMTNVCCRVCCNVLQSTVHRVRSGVTIMCYTCTKPTYIKKKYKTKLSTNKPTDTFMHTAGGRARSSGGERGEGSHVRKWAAKMP